MNENPPYLQAAEETINSKAYSDAMKCHLAYKLALERGDNTAIKALKKQWNYWVKYFNLDNIEPPPSK